MKLYSSNTMVKSYVTNLNAMSSHSILFCDLNDNSGNIGHLLTCVKDMLFYERITDRNHCH